MINMDIYINAETNKQIFKIKDYTTFSVDVDIGNNETKIQLLAFISNEDPIVVLEYNFDKDEKEDHQDYLDDVTQVGYMVETLCQELIKVIAELETSRSPTSDNTYIVNIYDYITLEGHFCMNYKIVTKILK